MLAYGVRDGRFVRAAASRFAPPTAAVDAAPVLAAVLAFRVRCFDGAEWRGGQTHGELRNQAVHLTGAFNVTRAAWSHLREQAYGRIVSTSSAAGIFGNFGQANYGAAKMGIVGLTHVWAQEGGKYNIRANAIAPVARTRMTEEILGPLVEKVDPALVSPVVAYLASEECQVTGEVYSVGAGRVSRIFIAEAPGFFKKDLSVEDVRDNWDTIRGEADYLIPTSVNDEFARLLMPALSDE